MQPVNIDSGGGGERTVSSDMHGPLSRYLSYLWGTFSDRMKVFDVVAVTVTYDTGKPVRHDTLYRIKLEGEPRAYCSLMAWSRFEDIIPPEKGQSSP